MKVKISFNFLAVLVEKYEFHVRFSAVGKTHHGVVHAGFNLGCIAVFFFLRVVIVVVMAGGLSSTARCALRWP